MRKVKMTFRAVKLRLARSLAHDDLYLKTCREGSRWYRDLGRHYVVNEHNVITAQHIDVEAWARERKVIGPEVSVEAEV